MTLCPSRCCTESSTLHNFLEALSRKFKFICPLELLYAHDLVLMAETLQDLKKKLTIWKDIIETKELWVNVKTILVCSKDNSPVKSDPIKWPCSICHKGVGISSIFCQSCNRWVQKRCLKIKGRQIHLSRVMPVPTTS